MLKAWPQTAEPILPSQSAVLSRSAFGENMVFCKYFTNMRGEKMKKVNWFVVLAGAAVGLAAVLLTLMGNPANMGFCIACFLRDIVGACGMHGAAVGQYVRPEIVG